MMKCSMIWKVKELEHARRIGVITKGFDDLVQLGQQKLGSLASMIYGKRKEGKSCLAGVGRLRV